MANYHAVSSGTSSGEQELLSLAHDLQLPSYEIGSRISDQRDLDYITGTAPQLVKSFVKDRSRLARMWVRENRLHLNQLHRLHRLIARASDSLSVAFEFRVALTFLLLQLLLRTADILVAFTGPFRARRIGLAAMGVYAHLSSTIATTAASLDPAKRAAIREGWARSG
jgi:hypothetical protein